MPFSDSCSHVHLVENGGDGIGARFARVVRFSVIAEALGKTKPIATAAAAAAAATAAEATAAAATATTTTVTPHQRYLPPPPGKTSSVAPLRSRVSKGQGGTVVDIEPGSPAYCHRMRRVDRESDSTTAAVWWSTLRCWKSDLNPWLQRWANFTQTSTLLDTGACVAGTTEFTSGKVLTTAAGHAAARRALARISTAAAGDSTQREEQRRECEHGGTDTLDIAVHVRAGDISNSRSSGAKSG